MQIPKKGNGSALRVFALFADFIGCALGEADEVGDAEGCEGWLAEDGKASRKGAGGPCLGGLPRARFSAHRAADGQAEDVLGLGGEEAGVLDLGEEGVLGLGEEEGDVLG